jgi:hypothetical protein
MTPEQKVVSLETAGKLKEAGFPQDMERWWNILEKEDGSIVELLESQPPEGRWLGFAAPDAQEIGELLPARLDRFGQLSCTKDKYSPDEWPVWECGYTSGERFRSVNEAEARAQLWLWLKEQKLI